MAGVMVVRHEGSKELLEVQDLLIDGEWVRHWVARDSSLTNFFSTTHGQTRVVVNEEEQKNVKRKGSAQSAAKLLIANPNAQKVRVSFYQQSVNRTLGQVFVEDESTLFVALEYEREDEYVKPYLEMLNRHLSDPNWLAQYGLMPYDL